MRLIDADALIKWINDQRCADCPDKQDDRCAACQWDDAIMMIEKAPIIATLEENYTTHSGSQMILSGGVAIETD